MKSFFVRQGRVASAVAALALMASASNAQVFQTVFDTEFTAAGGYNDGVVQFQQPFGSGNGIWLGQNFATVDTTAGILDGFNTFTRNAFSLGASGGFLNQSNGVGEGFVQGDQFRISTEFSISLPSNINSTFYSFGVTDCFRSDAPAAACIGGNFESAPRAGVVSNWSGFADGSLRLFTHPSAVGNNALALFLPGPDIGIINGNLPFVPGEPGGPDPNIGPEDINFDSDRIRVEYTAELTDAATNTWTAVELVAFNVDTETEITRASVDKPEVLQSFVFDTAANSPEDFNTDVFERGLATNPNDPGSELYFGARWADVGGNGTTNSVSSVTFEFAPAGGPVLDGDYNGDGVVNNADYAVFRSFLGAADESVYAPRTGNGLGIDDTDFGLFERNFGDTLPTTPATAAVPEPGTIALVLLGGVVASVSRRRS